MNVMLLGIGIGTLSLIPPGPVNLTLVHVGARLGRTTALRGAFGVMGGDSVLAVVAVLLLTVGAALPASVFSTAQLVCAGLLAAIGVALVLKPAAASTKVDRMQRPTRTFFLLTSLTPTALGSWVAMLAAMPFASDVGQLWLFAGGVVIASCFFHPALGLAAAAVGSRLGPQGQIRLAQIGGGLMAALGLALLVGNLV